MESRYNTDHKYTKRDEERRSRKLFIGGVSFSTNDEDFFKYFAKYGELEDCVLIREKDTGQSRGFGFVTYKDKAVSQHVATQQLYLDGRRLDPKPSISKHRNQTTKVFVGGLHDDTAEAELSEHFEGFGEVLEVNIMYDRFTNAPRGFGFVTFKESEVANKVIYYEKDHMIHGKKVDCKPATARKDAFKREDNFKDNYRRGANNNNNDDDEEYKKSTSREERWKKYHGDAEHGYVGVTGYPVPPPTHAPHPVHSSYSHSAYPYPAHSSYAHSSYARAPPPPPQYGVYDAQGHYAPQYDPYYRHDARYAQYPPPAVSGQTEYKYAPPAQYAPVAVSGQTQAPVRYDYYAQYVPPQGQVQGQGQGQVDSEVKKDKSVVLSAPIGVKGMQSGTQTIATQQVGVSSYGPSRGSKATNSAQGARYSAY